MGLLRVLLALSVVIDHSYPALGLTLVGGQVAVQTFFIISGFYMSLILDRKYVGPGSYGLFMTNRFLRLFPVYWMVWGLTLAVALLESQGRLSPWFDYHHILGWPAWVTLVFTNLMLFGQDQTLFL